METKIERLSFHYGDRIALSDVELTVIPGEVLALVGPNGSGKTTLLKNMSGVLKPSSGAVYLDGKELAAISPRQIACLVAAVEQEIEAGFDFTVREIVEMGRIPHREFLRNNNCKDRQVVDKAMRDTGVFKLDQRSIFSLSSGERQRVWLAMALAQEPGLLLLDEPTSHLDINFQMEILRLIKQLTKKKLTVVMAIHDLNLAAHYADRIALMKNGKIEATGTPRKVLTEESIRKVFCVRARIIDSEDDGFLINLFL